jgi:AcrR family transcriptional regulator
MLGNTNTDQSDAEAAPQVVGKKSDRRAARRDATKAEIVDAAWDLVREHGLAALSLRELADRVGMRAPSLYQYFSSKHAIYDAMFAQGMRAAVEAVRAPDWSGDARAVFTSRARVIVEFANSDPARAQLLFQRTIPGFEPSPEAYAPALELSALTQEVLDAHGITDPDALDLYTALVSGLINQQLANDPGGDRWIRLIDRVIDMYLAQVAPASRAPTKRGS